MTEFERPSRTRNSHMVSPAKPDRATFQPTHSVNPLLAQQQALGNQAAQRFAQSCPLRLPSPSVCPFGGACHTCPAQVQAKLKIGQPDDKYEREADRVAEQVMRMPEPDAQEEATVSGRSHGIHIQGACLECDDELRRQPLDEKERQRREEEILRQLEKLREHEEIEQLREQLFGTLPLQRSPAETPGQEHPQESRAPGTTAHGNSNLTGQINSLRGRGQPLSESVRKFFEPRFGCDFGKVEIHADEKAAALARSVNALAFTVGSNVVFGMGRFSPASARGRWLLAHELAHVVQQRQTQKSMPQFVQLLPLRGEDQCQTIEQELSQAHQELLRVELDRCQYQRWLREAQECARQREEGRPDTTRCLMLADVGWYRERVDRLEERRDQLRQREQRLREQLRGECGREFPRPSPPLCR